MKISIEYEIDDEVIEELATLLMVSNEVAKSLVEEILKEGARKVNEYLRKMLDVLYSLPEDKKEETIRSITDLAVSFGMEVGKMTEEKHKGIDPDTSIHNS